MPSVPLDRAGPLVTAVLVVNDGEAWLPSALQSLEEQDYPDLRLVVVDNGSRDGSRDIIAERVPVENVVTLNRSTGFGRAVRAAGRHAFVAEADFLLLLHDDLALDPHAVRVLVDALTEDSGLGIVGPKLREWTSEPVLQEVGMTVDRFGRAESRVERGELDQGHLDARRDVLYVSTAGMLVRASLFAELEGLDPRFPALRDDLDLCWRAWLLGWRVEVIPDAVGYHVAAGTRGGRRLWRDRAWQTRFLSERHALATLLKNYSWTTLLWVLPLTIVIGAAKLVGFGMTRRFSDVGATLRAYVWNLLELPRTLRHRRRIQRARRRRDAELTHLFATGMPRLLEYVDAIRDWLAGSDAPAMLPEQETPVRPQGNRVVRFARERPAFLVGGLLAAVYVASLVPLLGRGQLIGGTVLPWPASSGDFLSGYASPVSGDPLATGVSASPAQALLGLISFGAFGNEWLAQRLLVFGLLPLAWLTALRAGRLVTSSRGPRVVGATLYVLSPVVLGTLAQGRLGELVTAALFPAIVLLTARVANPRAAPRQAWRATAWLALSSAVVIAAAPGLWLLTVPVLAAGLAVALLPEMNLLARPVLRMLTAAAGVLGLLAPWLWDLARAPGTVLEPASATGLSAWRALTLTPPTLPGVQGGGAYAAAAVTLAVLVLALLLGLRLRPLPVTALFALLLSSAAVAWTADRLAMDWVWAPALLLPGAAAVAGLGVLAARTMVPALRDYTFGLPQVAVLVTIVPLVLGLVVVSWSVPTRGWDTFERDVELVPAYVSAEADRVGPYRILLLEEEAGDGLRWGVTEAAGPSMLEFGAARSAHMSDRLEQALAGVLAGNLEGGSALGAANVRYVVLTDDAPDVERALTRQPDVEPMVAGGGRVFRVVPWLPRAAALPTDVVGAALDPEVPVDLRPYEGDGLLRARPGVYEGALAGDDTAVVVSEEPGLWRVHAASGDLEAHPDFADGPLQVVTAGAAAGEHVVVEPSGRAGRALALVFQVLVLFGLVSLLLRPPGLARPSLAHLALHDPGLGTPWERGGYDNEPSLAERLETLGPSGERRR